MNGVQNQAQGQAATRLKARPEVIAQAVLGQSIVFTFLLAPPLACALLEQQWALAAALGVPTVAAAVARLSARHKPIAKDLRRVEAILALVLIFVLSFGFTIPAFVVLGLGPVDAAFEAMSAITTTGLSVAGHIETWPVSAHVLRAWMQWCGGLVMAIAGLALLLDRGKASSELGKAFIDDQSIVSSTRTHARQLLIGYLALTAFGVIGALAVIPGFWEGPVLALAAVSTGGFAPRPDSLASYSLEGQAFIVVLGVMGAVSLMFYVVALRSGPVAAWQSTTARAFLRIVGVSAAAYVLVQISLNGPGLNGLVSALLTLLSAQSTTGFSLTVAPPEPPLLGLLIGVMVIGGSIGSTGGGLKMDRLRLLARLISLVILRLSTPLRAVTALKLDGDVVEMERITFAAALLQVYLFTVFILWIAFLLCGHAPLASLFDIVSAVSTVGLSAGIVGPELSDPLKVMVIFSMLLGRLEFFGVIMLFLPQTWIRWR